MSEVSAAAVADACVLDGVPFNSAPALVPLHPGRRVNGRALPVVHRGSVDVFLEAIAHAHRGDVLVVDNDGRDDEGCIGDLVALEAACAGISGIVIWGRHRDTAVVATLPVAVWSRGAIPAGPLGVRSRRDDEVRVGDVLVRPGDLVVADDDGVVFAPGHAAADVVALAREIEGVERRQATRLRNGAPLREQLRFAEYLERRSLEPATTFREHLRAISAQIEA